MAHRIQLKASKELTATWSKVQDAEDFGFMEVAIDLKNSEFNLVSYEKAATGKAKGEPLRQVCVQLKEKNHQYFIIRDPLAAKKMFCLIHYGADLSPVKVRMIYASSRPTLKGHLGGDHFTSDYFISTTEECTFEAFNRRRNADLEIDLRRADEMERDEANHETMPSATKSMVMKSLQVQVTEQATEGATAFMTGDSKVAMFSLNPKNQSVNGEDCKADGLAALAKALPSKQPRYALFRFAHKSPVDGKQKESSGFVYYCPAQANRNEKFTYSTCKVNVVNFMEELGITIDFKLEVEKGGEINEKECMNSLYPADSRAAAVDLASRPKAPGRKKAKRRRRKVETKDIDE